MTTVDLLARIAMGWLVLSAIAGGAYATAMARHNSRERTRKITPAYPWCVPVRPPVTQAEVDAAWLDAWTDVEPSDIDQMEQRVYDRLFDELIAIEGLQ